MKLFELFAVLSLRTTDFEKGVKKMVAQGENASVSISNGLKKATSTLTKGLTIGLTAVSTGITYVTKKALDFTGELEQNLGGSEAVWEEYAEKIQTAGKNAFGMLGLSTSEYLATANKMGSLFMGAGFETEEALDLTMEAMQRAADVASIMGIDVEWAMESIAGAAKGNFTMMDNLGVAINDTTLAQYALSKGITKSTQAMTTQEKVALAMELFLERTAYAAGNYARENDTLAGALGTAKAAFVNFLDGSGNVDDFVAAAVKAGRVVIKNLGEIVPRLFTSSAEAVRRFIPYVEAAWVDVWDNKLPGIITSGANSVIGMINGVFGTNIPMIETIKLPTWEQVSSSIDNWWNGENGIKAGIQNFCEWTLKLFNEPSAAVSDAAAAISTWWESTGRPGVLSASQWALNLFGYPVEDNATITSHVGGWWATAGNAVIAACTWALQLFGLPKENAESIKTKVSTWWTGIAPAVTSAVSFALKCVGVGPWTDEDTERLRDWWDGVCETIVSIVNWILSPELPDADVVISAIESWWEDVSSVIKLFLPSPTFANGVSDAASAVEDAVTEATGSKELGQQAGQLTKTFADNPDSFADWGAIAQLLFSDQPPPSGGQRVGLDYVPYDDFAARLHEGEAVLTKQEAEAWRRSGSDTSSGIDYDRLAGAVAAAMSRLHIQMDARTVGQLVTDTVSEEIAKRSRQGRFVTT